MKKARYRVAGYKHPADNARVINGILLESEDDSDAPEIMVSVNEALSMHAKGMIDTVPDDEEYKN